MGTNEESGFPVPAGESPLEASTRAPTLMAGGIPGSQGEVKVWAPLYMQNRGRIIGPLYLAVSSAVAAAVCFFLPWVGHAVGIYFFYSLGISWLLWLRELLRPTYVTTDDVGIAVTLWRGTDAFRWEQIESMELGPLLLFWGTRLRLDLRTGESVHVSLEGLAAKPLLSLIREKAHLVQDPENPRRCIWRKSLPPEGGRGSEPAPPEVAGTEAIHRR